MDIAYWFGTREHENLDKLMELLAPLEIGEIHTDGNYAYFKLLPEYGLVVNKENTQKIDGKHLSLRTCVQDWLGKVFAFQKVHRCIKL